MVECYVPPRELRDIRALVRRQAALVRMRSTVKNRVHALVDQRGLRCECTDMFSKGGLRWLRGLELGDLERLMLDVRTIIKILGTIFHEAKAVKFKV